MTKYNVNATISRDILEEVVDCMITASRSGYDTLPRDWLESLADLLTGILNDS